MFTQTPEVVELSEAWIESDDRARWRSASGHGPGAAAVIVGDDSADASEGGIALVPKGLPHEVHNAGEEVLRFWAIYAAPEVTTLYEEPVQPNGGRERNPVGG